MAEKELRKRGWFVQRNWNYDKADPTSKYHGVDGDTWRDGVVQEWSQLAQSDKVDWCNFIVHDKDEIKDKKTDKITMKPIHMHAVVKYKDAKTQATVLRDFCGSNERVENCKPVDPQKGGYRSALLYLTHHTTSAYNDYKTWYHHTDVHQYKRPFLELITTDKRERKASKDAENFASALCEGIGMGEVKLADAKKQFKEQEGAYALTKYRSAFESADDDYKLELIQKMQRISATGQFSKRTTYISGPGRAGKTVLAECMAVDLHGADDVYVPATGGSGKLTDDFVDLHHTEKATVFSDLDPNAYPFKGFLNMFDPYKWSPTKSRNKSKPWLSTDCYIADTLSLGEFLIRMINGGRSNELAIMKETANDLIMGFGRISRVVSYGENNGTPVVWVGRLKPEFPTSAEVVEYAKFKIGRTFNSKIIGIFYETLGCVPYDKSAPIYEERLRMAKIINAVYAGDMQANGFVPVAQPVVAVV